MRNKAGALLGLCAKAGKVESGEFAAENVIKKNRAYLAVLASDASENTKKKFSNMCAYRHIPCIETGDDKEQLGRRIGRQMRSVAAVCDRNLAEAIRAAVNDTDQDDEDGTVMKKDEQGHR